MPFKRCKFWHFLKKNLYTSYVAQSFWNWPQKKILLYCVRAPVLLQVTWISKSFVALAACKWLLSCMQYFVCVEATWKGESFVAMIAGRWFFSCMVAQMWPHLTFCWGSFVALSAVKRLISCMADLVYLQVSSLRITLVTLVAGKNSLLYGRAFVSSCPMRWRKFWCTGCK